ncbi:MAG: 50S ribosomal protein L34 [Patescibacteria group bacterium]
MSQTYQPKQRRRHKKHGFLVRQRSASGKQVVLSRRRKGRKRLTV